MKQNLRKKALFPAIAMVLAAVIALSGVTYAWFTTGNTANVNSLNVNVQTANGIQLSLDGKAWKSTLTANDIITAIEKATDYSGRVIQYPAGEIAPVSSAGIVSGGKMQMFLGEYNEDGSLKSTALEDKNGTEGNYIAFDLFFKYSGNQPLSLNVGDGQSFVTTVSIGADGKATQLTDAADMGTRTAVRVGFVPMGSFATDAEARNQKDAVLDNPEEVEEVINKVNIWEPNSQVRAAGSEGGSGKLDYVGFKAAFAAGTEGALTADQAVKVETLDENMTIMNLSKTYSKVRVYIWLEGQDVDCINNISNGDFSVTLQFAVPEITPETTNGAEGN